MTSEHLFLDALPSPIGRLLLVSDEAQQLHMIEWEERDATLRTRLSTSGAAWSDRSHTDAGSIGDPLRAYFAGAIDALAAVRVVMTGTPFQDAVWSALRSIPAGERRTYGDIARQIDRPTAFRAVGLANGANPVPVVVPCHRVIGSDGSLTGFGGGMERKRWLLKHEGVPIAEPDRQLSLLA